MGDTKSAQISYDLISSPMLINDLVKKYVVSATSKSGARPGGTTEIKAMADRALLSLQLNPSGLGSGNSSLTNKLAASRGQSRTATTILDTSKTTDEIKCYNDINQAKREAYTQSRRSHFKGFTVFPRKKSNTVSPRISAEKNGSSGCSDHEHINRTGSATNRRPDSGRGSQERGGNDDDDDEEYQCDSGVNPTELQLSSNRQTDRMGEGSQDISRIPNGSSIQIHQIYDNVVGRGTVGGNNNTGLIQPDLGVYTSSSNPPESNRSVLQRMSERPSYSWERTFPSVRLGDGSVLQNLYPSLSHVKLKTGKIERVDAYIRRISENPRLFEKVVTIQYREYEQWGRTSIPSEVSLHRPVPRERMESKSVGPSYETLRSIHPLTPSYNSSRRKGLPEDLSFCDINNISNSQTDDCVPIDRLSPLFDGRTSQHGDTHRLKQEKGGSLSGSDNTPTHGNSSVSPNQLTMVDGSNSDEQSSGSRPVSQNDDSIKLTPLRDLGSANGNTEDGQMAMISKSTALPAVETAGSRRGTPMKKRPDSRQQDQGTFCKLSTAQLVVNSSMKRASTSCEGEHSISSTFCSIKTKERLAREYTNMQINKANYDKAASMPSLRKSHGNSSQPQEWSIPMPESPLSLSAHRVRSEKDRPVSFSKAVCLCPKFSPETLSSVTSPTTRHLMTGLEMASLRKCHFHGKEM